MTLHDPKARKEIVIAMAATGLSRREIAERLGVTRNTIVGILHRAQGGGEPRVVDMQPLSADESKRAASMWRDGYKMREIADALEIAYRRLAWVASLDRDTFPKRGGSGVYKRAKRRTAARPATARAPDGRTCPVRIDLSKRAIPEQKPVEFWALKANQCIFILEHASVTSGPFSPCCGAERADGKPYCRAHCRVVYTKDVA